MHRIETKQAPVASQPEVVLSDGKLIDRGKHRLICGIALDVD